MSGNTFALRNTQGQFFGGNSWRRHSQRHRSQGSPRNRCGSQAWGAALLAVALLFAASASSAQDGVDLYGETEATLAWDSASGPVAGYYVVVSRNGGEPSVDGVVVEPTASISAEFGESIVVSVNAFNAEGLPGPASENSPEIRFHAPPANDDPGDPPPSDDPDPTPTDDDPPPPDEEPPAPKPPARVAQAFDFTGNGTSDLILSPEGKMALFALDPDAPPRELVVPEASSDWHLVGTGDADGNGAKDLIFENAQTQGSVLLLFDNGEIVAGGTPKLDVAPADTPWHVIGAGDFDGDGRDDLARLNPMLQLVELAMMDGTSILSTVQLAAEPNTSKAAAIDDFDGDSIDEILWIDDDGHGLTLWDLVDSAADSFPLAELGSGWKVIGSGDYDGDKLADLFVHHGDSGQLEVWLLNGPTILGTLALPNADGSDPVGVGDYDGDGHTDIAHHQRDTNRVVGWLSDGQGVHETLLLDANEWDAPPVPPEPEPTPTPKPQPTDSLKDRLCQADTSGDGTLDRRDMRDFKTCFRASASSECDYADLDFDGLLTNSDSRIFRDHLGSKVCEN